MSDACVFLYVRAEKNIQDREKKGEREKHVEKRGNQNEKKESMKNSNKIT